MQQVVDLQEDPRFQALGVDVFSISPDPAAAWKQEGTAFGIRMPMLSDPGNSVAFEYGVMRWGMPTGEPGHTFVLIGPTGKIVWIRDYGAPENGGLMYVEPSEVGAQVANALGAASDT